MIPFTFKKQKQTHSSAHIEKLRDKIIEINYYFLIGKHDFFSKKKRTEVVY